MIWLAWWGCGEPAATGPAPKRFDAVLVDPSKTPKAEVFCDSYAPAETADPFVAPALAGASWAPPKGWRWVNVWATWCGPCVAEMPRLAQWRDQLEKEHVPVELVFLSVDADQPVVDRFYAKEKGLPPSLRIADVAALPEWLAAVGLDAMTPIPIHFFVDGEGRTRCVRTGAISEGDYRAVKQVLGG